MTLRVVLLHILLFCQRAATYLNGINALKRDAAKIPQSSIHMVRTRLKRVLTKILKMN